MLEGYILLETCGTVGQKQIKVDLCLNVNP